jgi:shikimate dehydrogenase
MTSKTGIIGYPLTHSLSPVFQQAAFDYLNLDIKYELWETDTANLRGRVQLLRSSDCLGSNVTIPYKETVIDLLDRLDEKSSMIGAVNTIVNENGILTGYNTDAYGFIKALQQDAQFNPQGADVIILGAGGAARAVGFSLVQEKVHSITFLNRTFAHAEKIAMALRKYAEFKKLAVRVDLLPWDAPEFIEVAAACHLIVNCTSFGTRFSSLENKSPIESRIITGNILVFDLVYNPGETPLLKMAEKAGARTIGGLPMLVYQGAAAFKLWTGIKAPESVMLSTAKRAMDKFS